MSDEITESAKATQEIAKTTGKAIEAAEKMGSFISRIIGEPLDAISGMVTDRLRFMRWERQTRFVDRYWEIINRRQLAVLPGVAPPKLVLPIIEHASLEENNELQDLWANLLASIVDPKFSEKIRTAYIDILKELEVIDVHVLNFIYKQASLYAPSTISTPMDYPVLRITIASELQIDPIAYETSIDNLIRVRCTASFVEAKNIKTSTYDHNEYYENVTTDHRYDVVCLTSLGLGFVEACISNVDEG
jgi:hypothetical protein